MVKPKRRFKRAGKFDKLIEGAHLALAALRVGIAEEAVARERYAVAQAAAQNIANGHVPGLAQNIEAGEFQRRQDLRAVVIQGGGRVGDEESHLFQTRGVVAHQIRLHGAEHGFGRFAAAAHLAQADQAVIGFHFDNGADKAAPVAAIGMAQRGFQRNRDRGGADVADLHNLVVWYNNFVRNQALFPLSPAVRR